MPKVYSFNTFFYPKVLSGGHQAVRRWTKQVDLFSYDYVLVPVHLGMHWCLAVSCDVLSRFGFAVSLMYESCDLGVWTVIFFI